MFAVAKVYAPECIQAFCRGIADDYFCLAPKPAEKPLLELVSICKSEGNSDLLWEVDLVKRIDDGFKNLFRRVGFTLPEGEHLASQNTASPVCYKVECVLFEGKTIDRIV